MLGSSSCATAATEALAALDRRRGLDAGRVQPRAGATAVVRRRVAGPVVDHAAGHAAGQAEDQREHGDRGPHPAGRAGPRPGSGGPGDERLGGSGAVEPGRRVRRAAASRWAWARAAHRAAHRAAGSPRSPEPAPYSSFTPSLFPVARNRTPEGRDPNQGSGTARRLCTLSPAGAGVVIEVVGGATVHGRGVGGRGAQRQHPHHGRTRGAAAERDQRDPARPGVRLGREVDVAGRQPGRQRREQRALERGRRAARCRRRARPAGS